MSCHSKSKEYAEEEEKGKEAVTTQRSESCYEGALPKCNSRRMEQVRFVYGGFANIIYMKGCKGFDRMNTVHSLTRRQHETNGGNGGRDMDQKAKRLVFQRKFIKSMKKQAFLLSSISIEDEMSLSSISMSISSSGIAQLRSLSLLASSTTQALAVNWLQILELSLSNDYEITTRMRTPIQDNRAVKDTFEIDSDCIRFHCNSSFR